MAYSKMKDRQRFELISQQLKNERASFEPFWRNIGDYVLPTRIRFNLSETNEGSRKNSKINNSSATLASRTLRSGMMAGITSPARPWFRLATPDRGLMEYGPVKQWLQLVEEEMRSQFLVSNIYNSLPTVYGDVGNFATGAIFMEEDFETVSRFYTFPIGSFYIANDEKLRVRVFMREFRMTVRQLVGKFVYDPITRKMDWSNVSDTVKMLWESNHAEAWVDICHIVMPNDDYNPDALDYRQFPFVSVYYELGSVSKGLNSTEIPGYGIGGVGHDRVLSKKGYNYFPVLCPRWEVTGQDVYGSDCPGMTAFGDSKSLQTKERRLAQAIEKIINPPMQGPSMLKNSKASLLPGDITYVDVREGLQGFRPTHEVNPRVIEMFNYIQRDEQRISRAYYEDLFLMLSYSDRREITAREIDERHEEKLLMLGPVLEQLNQDLLDPLIDNQFDFAMRQNRFPPPPEELAGQTLKVEYISVMAQAQKLVGLSNIERFVGFSVNIATQTQDPSRLDKVDFDQAIDRYGERIGVDPDIIVSDERVAAMREQRAQAQAAQAQMASMQGVAETAEKLSKADLEKDSALKRLVGE
jgi:hypothetical protein